MRAFLGAVGLKRQRRGERIGEKPGRRHDRATGILEAGQAMFALQAYFDDGGAPGEQVVGGCVANAEAWATFDTEWAAVLDRFDVEEFHAAPFENRRGQFEAMPAAHRTPFRNALLNVLLRHVNPATGGPSCVP
jgi:hypothetical protein